jgi:hypothetical protein
MRSLIEDRLPALVVLDGSAEAIPLGDGVADAVVAGNAFRHFDADRAFAEIRRTEGGWAPSERGGLGTGHTKKKAKGHVASRFPSRNVHGFSRGAHIARTRMADGKTDEGGGTEGAFRWAPKAGFRRCPPEPDRLV